MARKKDRDRDRDDDRPRRPEPVKRDGPYVVMLFITFMAVTIGCVLLYLDFSEYGGKSAPSTPVPAVLKLGEAAPPATAGAPAAAPKGSDTPPAP
ncbi:hypothetical protein GobsT_75210 [Gemmata obscuriglobus]|uniref:Uncharacterized protein n=1 Tax=Gemmata obscuriglobus TaxID=114 RepID=A0A2Z3H962_9BACT|nr:hypothetical protein [Gemmata obscuriglobus]AWM41431.1 hypothetical protein C1280_33495 [Gemmata obscuriglobus]QEG32663.1 hypothetical protein GobsT_75210 [Gemmata obscuriglobus]VTS12019.1 unnamed protein product [Gemmata obscuriglobus UQM 2246]